MVVDIGYLANARSELQRTADSAALAACWEYAGTLAEGGSESAAALASRTTAGQAAGPNDVCNAAMQIAPADIVIGYLADFHDRSSALLTSNSALFNAVEVRARKAEGTNGPVPFFFARIFGYDGMPAEATATAAVVKSVGGFQTPSDGSNVEMLPFALDWPTWSDLLNGNAADDFTWNSGDRKVENGPDGILEVNLYPKGNGSPGNRGTVDIGSSNNSTADIARQILSGISPSDLAYHNGKLEFDNNGELPLNGDTGISAGVKDELQSIIGKPRIIPIFSQVNGPGNNAIYTIVRFAGIRIMEVKLTGSKSSKRLIIQPAPLTTKGVIPSPQPGTSDFVYSPVFLVR